VTIAPFLFASGWVIVSGLALLLARDPVGERQRASAPSARPRNSG